MMTSTVIFYSARLAYLAGLGLAVFALVLLALMSISDSAQASTGELKYSRALIKRMVVAEAQVNGIVPPALAMAVAKVESDFQAHVKSSAGARGVMQIMPATAKGEFGVRAKRLWDPKLNIALGIRYLEQLYRQYDNRWDLALSHYNGGTIKNGRPHSYTQKYVSDVMGYWRKFQRSEIILAMADDAQKPASFVKVRKYSFDTNTKSALNQQFAADYWLIDDPKTEKNWREYLKIADRWLKRDGNGFPAIADSDSIPYGTLGESQIKKTTLRERFRASLNNINQATERSGSARFM